MSQRRLAGIVSSLAIVFFAGFAVMKSAHSAQPTPPSSHGILVVANQVEHTTLLIDPDTHKELAKINVGVNGHEVTVDPANKFAYVPIYGNSGVGKPGSDGSSIDVIDIANRKLAYSIDLGKPLRPHDPHFGPDGNLYVTAELTQSIDAIDVKTRKIVAENPTGQDESHMFVIRPGPDHVLAYTANVHTGTVSVVNLETHTHVKTIPVSTIVQRISIQPDGLYIFTHDQAAPRIVIIDPLSNNVSTSIELPETVYSSAPTPDGHYLVAGGMKGHIFVIDLHTRKLFKTFDAPTALAKTLVRPDGEVAYISFLTAGKIIVLDLKNWKLQPSIDLTPGVDGMAWAATD
jgi:DNA-binding beta-propeller fold protein YncE